jgi:hypothetical protein
MYELTLVNHPSQARHPFTKKPLFDNDDNPVPLFPGQRCVKLDGRSVAYVSEAGNIGFITASLPQAIVDDIAAFVKREFIEPKNIVIPQPIEPDTEDE